MAALVAACTASRELRVRQLAAKSLLVLVGADELPGVLQRLLQALPQAPPVQHNAVSLRAQQAWPELPWRLRLARLLPAIRIPIGTSGRVAGTGSCHARMLQSCRPHQAHAVRRGQAPCVQVHGALLSVAELLGQQQLLADGACAWLPGILAQLQAALWMLGGRAGPAMALQAAYLAAVVAVTDAVLAAAPAAVPGSSPASSLSSPQQPEPLRADDVSPTLQQQAAGLRQRVQQVLRRHLQRDAQPGASSRVRILQHAGTMHVHKQLESCGETCT